MSSLSAVIAVDPKLIQTGNNRSNFLWQLFYHPLPTIVDLFSGSGTLLLSAIRLIRPRFLVEYQEPAVTFKEISLSSSAAIISLFKYEQEIIDLVVGGPPFRVSHLYTDGNSSDRVIRLTRPNKLLLVGKIGRIDSIENEFNRYNLYICNFQRRVAKPITQDPIYSTDGRHAGIFYELVGETLNNYLITIDGKPDSQKIAQLFTEFVDQLHPQWMNCMSLERDVPLSALYDRDLPCNLQLKWITNKIKVKPLATLTPNWDANLSSLILGNIIRIRGLFITNIVKEPNGFMLTLNIHPDAGKFVGQSYRIQLWVPNRVGRRYKIGDTIKMAKAQITDTRFGMIRKRLASIPELKATTWTSELIQIKLGRSQKMQLLNPLPVLEETLKLLQNVVLCRGIHGDCHFGNITVTPEGHFDVMIDFGLSREGWPCEDLFKVEESLLLWLTSNLRHDRTRHKKIAQFYRDIHNFQCCNCDDSTDLPDNVQWVFAVLKLIREQATNYLYNKRDMAEYYRGLLVHLIGMIRYPRINDTWTLLSCIIAASTIAQILKEQSTKIPYRVKASYLNNSNSLNLLSLRQALSRIKYLV